jgi:hypothetical protein
MYIMFGGFSVIPGTLFAEFVKRKIILEKSVCGRGEGK